MKNIMFLCTGNSCRSQMAEGIARAVLPDHVNVYSAGIVAHGMNPNVASVMAELDISLDSHSSKSTDELPDVDYDVVITVCDNAAEQCPVFPAKTNVHQPFPDPPKLAAEQSDEQAKLDCYRQVRDQISTWLKQPDTLQLLS